MATGVLLTRSASLRIQSVDEDPNVSLDFSSIFLLLYGVSLILYAIISILDSFMVRFQRIIAQMRDRLTDGQWTLVNNLGLAR